MNYYFLLICLANIIAFEIDNIINNIIENVNEVQHVLTIIELI
jgi:hypothetical protein